MIFDFIQYGLSFHREDGSCKFYRKTFPDNSFVEVMNSNNCIFVTHEFYNRQPTVVADRYQCETVEQLEFLLFNGRVGYLFKPKIS